MPVVLRLAVLLVLSLPGLGFAAFFAVNPKLSSLLPDQQPRKVLLLPPQMFVAQLFAGGVIQKQDDWTKLANKNLLDAARRYARESSRFDVLSMPELTEEESEIVESHIGLYERIAAAIYAYGQGKDSGWAQKKDKWDYTLGDGLDFLREKTGADSALIFIGTDIISSSGRKAAFAVGLLIGVVIPLGQSFITAGLIDLKTGEIHWLAYDQSLSLDSRDAGEVDKLVRTLLETYPVK